MLLLSLCSVLYELLLEAVSCCLYTISKSIYKVCYLRCNTNMASSKGSDSTKITRYNLPSGKVPLLSALDDEVDWTMVAIEMRAFLMRFEGYEEALFERQLEDVNARAEQKRRLGKNNALKIVYSYLVEMCAPNKTAMFQVREHASTDPEFYANNLWIML